MASQAQPAVVASHEQAPGHEPLVYMPNVRPEGIELAGDRHWRDWRLRKRRPELRERYTGTFPNINPLLDREANARIDAEHKVNVVPFTKRTLAHLRKDPNYRVERLQFRPLQDTHDRVDAIWAATRPRKPRTQEELDKLPSFFFEGLSSSLFARVWDFAAETFGQKPAADVRSEAQKEADFDRRLRDTDWTGRFLQYLPSEFIRCVSEVARGDYRNRGWKDYDPHGYEFLFLDRDQRIHLCTAVIAKLLQEQCFEPLLFGARKIERDALRKTDEAQEDIANGFARKMSRTSSVPKYLIRDLFTENFWEEVDRVTMGILEILLPVINFVGELEPGVGALPLMEVHQQLHNIVAEAGWLANGLALTRSCFWIDFPQPGQLWDVRQEHVTDIVWTASKAFADYSDSVDLDDALLAWREARMPVYDALTDDPKPALGMWSRSTFEIDNPRPRQVRRTAKVQISMWPFLERSYPHKQELVSGEFNLGESTTILQKAQVVYYAGNDTDAGEKQENYTLQQYLEDYRRSNAIFWGPRAWFAWPVILLVLSYALYFAGPRIRAGYHEFRHSDWGLQDQVISSWNWPTWEWPSLGGPSATRGRRPPIVEPLQLEAQSCSPTEVTVFKNVKKLSTASSQSIKSSPSSRSRPKPPVYTSDVYSTRSYTKTRSWTTTRLHGSRGSEDPERDDLKGSTTTVPTNWKSAGKLKKQTSKPLPEKPTTKLSQDSSSTTELPYTVGTPEPTEEPFPVLTPSIPPDVSSTEEETSTEHPAPSKSPTSQRSFWKEWFSLGHAGKEAAEDDKHVTVQEDEVLSDEGPPSDDLISGRTKSDQDKTAIEQSGFTKMDSNGGVDTVSTENVEELASISSILSEEDGDTSILHETTSKQEWLSWISSAWGAPSLISSSEDDQPGPSFTTDVPPDVVFTDPAKPGVTLDMEDGFWVAINPLGLEYNCWVKSGTAECTSTVWTTVTAEHTATPKVTEGPWESTVQRGQRVR